MRYCKNNYGEKIGILAVLHSSTSVFPCQFIFPLSSMLIHPTTHAALSTCAQRRYIIQLKSKYLSVITAYEP
jgi:hypothetical protein